MKLKPKFGIDGLLFGMAENDVTEVLGIPDRAVKDEEQNIVFIYNSLKLRLTFYADENFRLGYILTSNANISIFGITIMGQNVEKIKGQLQEKGIKDWTIEEFDNSINHFSESNWIILEEEFNEIIKVEIGAIINNSDEFEWKFTK